MSSTMSSKSDLDVLNALLNDWDPIGAVPALKQDGVPLDEYRRYAPAILEMLREGAAESGVAKELERIVAEVLGIAVDPLRESTAARRIVRWFTTRR